MVTKIIKRTNPIGKVTFVALVKVKILLVFSVWRSIRYLSSLKEVSIHEHDAYSYEYNSLDDAKESIQKYIEWNNGKSKAEEVWFELKQSKDSGELLDVSKLKIPFYKGLK